MRARADLARLAGRGRIVQHAQRRQRFMKGAVEVILRQPEIERDRPRISRMPRSSAAS
jgi:hypothetical protein